MSTGTDAGLQAQIRQAWARGAATYDDDIGHGAMTDALHAAWLRELPRVVGEAPLDVLDVGTGTGFLAVLLAELGHRVRGVDLSSEMLARARQRAAGVGVNVPFVEGTATRLPLDDASVDLVISRHVFWTMPDPRAAVLEWIRVARTGGRVLWIDWLAPRPGAPQQGRRVVADLLRRLQRREAEREDHAYPLSAYRLLPMQSLHDLRPVRAFLLGLGVQAPRVELLPALAHAERADLELHRRIADASNRYVAGFTVTPELKALVSG